jgi:hypothetical protein
VNYRCYNAGRLYPYYHCASCNMCVLKLLCCSPYYTNNCINLDCKLISSSCSLRKKWHVQIFEKYCFDMYINESKEVISIRMKANWIATKSTNLLLVLLSWSFYKLMPNLYLLGYLCTVYYEWVRGLNPASQVKGTYLSFWNVSYSERGDTFLVQGLEFTFHIGKILERKSAILPEIFLPSQSPSIRAA